MKCLIVISLIMKISTILLWVGIGIINGITEHKYGEIPSINYWLCYAMLMWNLIWDTIFFIW